MAEPAESEIIPRQPEDRSRRRRWIGRLVLVGVVLMCLDICPDSMPLLKSLKSPLSSTLCTLGLNQGSWSMFAPNPTLNNGWVTAELRTADERIIQWDSPIWARHSHWDRFWRFRTLNYFNRLPNTHSMRAVADLMDFLARNSGEEIVGVKLYRNRLNLIMPEDGSLPLRDEAEWRLTPEPWLDRKQLP